ncbi:ESPR-type extended signal peptide-containing protein [Pusillimonas sp.]|uniref:ESPR-type extended signal peptide-containing protein n=1 Tax=Pusillimonas sp. TaxID=3040095 RepID=UPI0037C98E27
MNKAYKSIYNESTGTFVAVAENVKARGKRASSRVGTAGKLAAMIASSVLFVGSAIAQVLVEDGPGGNAITFTSPGGSIDFGSGGSISGLSSLAVTGGLSASQLTLGGTLFNARDIATTTALSATNANVNALQGQVADLGTSITTNSLTVAGDVLVASSSGVTVGAELNMGDNKITGLADGDIGAASTDAITGRQIHNLFIEEGAGGVRYFHANSKEPDSQASGQESIAIGPNTVAEGDSSFAAGDGAQALEDNSFAAGAGAIADGSSSIALGHRATVSKPADQSDPTAAIAIGQDSASSGVASTAIGRKATASGAGAIALGDGAMASGGNGIALGEGALAGAANNVSIGNAAGVGTGGVTAGDQVNNIAIGDRAGQYVIGQRNVAMGKQAGSSIEGNDNIAFGERAGSALSGDSNISIGIFANQSAGNVDRAIGIGQDSRAGTDGIAIGHLASAAGINGVALGLGANTGASGVAVGANASAISSFVALGAGSRAVASDVDETKLSAFTGREFVGGTAVSVGSSVAGSEFTRRIVNVEDGANETDAVNVRQLLTAIEDAEKFGGPIDYDELAEKVDGSFAEQIADAKSKYVSTNDGGVSKGNRNNDGALADYSIAIGPDATSTGTNSSAIGSEVDAAGASSVALGHDVKSWALNTTTIGNSRTEARDVSGVAIGTNVQSRGLNSIVIGRDSESDDQDGPVVHNSIVIGTESKSTAREGIVIGRESLVNAARGIAQGDKAEATAVDAMAFGTGSRAKAVNSQASGTGAIANAEGGIALGEGAKAGQDITLTGDANENSIAIGTGAFASKDSSIATGTGAQATADWAQASGYDAQATEVNAMALGHGARATEQDASAFGSDARASQARALAFGTGSRASGVDSSAFGSAARAEASNASAFGRGAVASNPDSVALGAGSFTGNSFPTIQGTVGGITYGSYAGSEPNSVVSVGRVGDERQISNLAAGRVTETSTDAINGSQLFATNTVLGNVANSLADGGNSVLGGTANVGNDGTITMTDIGETGEDTVHDAIKYAAQGWDVSANGETAQNVRPGGSVDFGNTDGNIDIARDGTDLEFNLSDDVVIGNSITVGDTVVNDNGLTVGDTVVNGDRVATANLTATGETRLGDNFVVGNDGTATYNGSEVATQADGLSFAGNTGGTIAKTLGDDTPLTISGDLAADADASGANLRVDSVDGKLNLVMAQDLTDLNSITINGGPVINGDGIDMNNKRITNLAPGVDGTDAVNVDQLGEIESIAQRGWDISTNGDNAETVAPGNSVNFTDDGNVLVSNSVDADGNHTLNVELAEDLTGLNSVGLNGIDGQDGLTIRGGDGAPGVGGADGITRIIYEDEGGNVREVATMDDGLSFAGNTGDDIVKKLGETLTISGALDEGDDATGANLRVDSLDGKLNLVMAQDLTDLNSITINGGPVINGDGIDMNNKRITNLAPGVDGTDAVNVDQLGEIESIAQRGWDISTNGDNAETVAPGNSVNFTDDGNVLVSNSVDADGNHTLNVELADDIEIANSITVGNSVLDTEGLTVTDADNITEVGAGTISVTDAGGTTLIKGNQIEVGGDNPVRISGDTGTIDGLTNKTIDYDGFADGSGRAATEDQLDLVNQTANAGWNVFDAEGNEANIGPSGQVTFVAGNENLSVKLSDDTDDAGVVEITLADNIELSEDGSIAIGDVTDGSTLDTNGLTVADGGNQTEVGAGTISVTDPDGSTTIGGNQIAIGGNNPIVISGNTGIISGLQNQTVHYAGFGDGSGRAATEEQLKPITDFVSLNEDGTFSYNGGQYASLQGALDSMHWNVEAPAPDNAGGDAGGSGGSGSGGSGGNSGSGGDTGSGGGTPIHNSNTVGFVEGDNIVISKTDRVNDAGQTVGADIKVAVSQDLKVNSITAVQVQADEIQINNGGPIINENGIDMSGKPITNVAAGVNETDAVNVGQLQQATGNLQGQVNSLRNDVRRLDNKLSAGVAAAMATAALPQAYLPGKNMMAMAGGTWNGETGMAIGFSGITDNGKWVYKVSGNATSRGDYGGAVGVGFQW